MGLPVWESVLFLTSVAGIDVLVLLKRPLRMIWDVVFNMSRKSLPRTFDVMLIVLALGVVTFGGCRLSPFRMGMSRKFFLSSDVRWRSCSDPVWLLKSPAVIWMSCGEFIWFSCKVVKKSLVLSAVAVCSAALLAGVGMKKEVPIFMYDFAVMWGRFNAVSSGIVNSVFGLRRLIGRVRC